MTIAARHRRSRSDTLGQGKEEPKPSSSVWLPDSSPELAVSDGLSGESLSVRVIIGTASGASSAPLCSVVERHVERTPSAAGVSPTLT